LNVIPNKDLEICYREGKKLYEPSNTYMIQAVEKPSKKMAHLGTRRDSAHSNKSETHQPMAQRCHSSLSNNSTRVGKLFKSGMGVCAPGFKEIGKSLLKLGGS